MSAAADGGPGSPGAKPGHRLPTLTEVIAVPAEGGDTTVPAALDMVTPAPPLAALPSEDELVARVLADVQRQVDLMLEYRLREVLAPALARATDALVREARNELAGALREIVGRSVAQELSRHRGGDAPR